MLLRRPLVGLKMRPGPFPWAVDKVVAQVSQPAVSQCFQPADAANPTTLSDFVRTADRQSAIQLNAATPQPKFLECGGRAQRRRSSSFRLGRCQSGVACLCRHGRQALRLPPQSKNVWECPQHFGVRREAKRHAALAVFARVTLSTDLGLSPVVHTRSLTQAESRANLWKKRLGKRKP